MGSDDELNTSANSSTSLSEQIDQYKKDHAPSKQRDNKPSMTSLGGLPLINARRYAVTEINEPLRDEDADSDAASFTGGDEFENNKDDDDEDDMFSFGASPFAKTKFTGVSSDPFRSRPAVDTSLQHTLEIAGKAVDVLIQDAEAPCDVVCGGNISQPQRVYNILVFDTVTEIMPRDAERFAGNIRRLRQYVLNVIEKWMFIQQRTSPSSLPFVEAKDSHEEWNDLSEAESHLTRIIGDTIFSELLLDTAKSMCAIEKKRASVAH
eukprot:TRINITY_DN54011_c0_g1_i1.p1 TRINITY_DN54011_c0_g1~~TRINITY_DN54011_c0_g1_i1.p1  ORF type:complete len:303 (+),score=47.50 TRINITY_DN54011_c0_g1_i1:117-911(+)